jgi:hypothetical protein
MDRLTLKEKTLYHQIHPAKLLTDWIAGIAALYPLWQHQLLAALLIVLVPPLIASVLLMRFANLEKYKQSPFGRYVRRYMTHAVEAVRLSGYIAMALGAWYHVLWLIPVELLVVVVAWLRGMVLPRAT